MEYVSVAQLDRAQASDAWCRWFESNRVHQKKDNQNGCLFFGVFGRSKRRIPVGSREERYGMSLFSNTPLKYAKKYVIIFAIL